MPKPKEQLVKLWKRPSKDGNSFLYYLRFVDLAGKRHMDSLGHRDEKKAEKQRAQKEKELRMGYCLPDSMRLKDFAMDSLDRTGDQIRQSSRTEYESIIRDFVSVIGNIDVKSVTLDHGEYYRQFCRDKGNSVATVRKKLRHLKRLFTLAVKRKQIEENPFTHIDMPRMPSKSKVRIYSEKECMAMLKAAKDIVSGGDPQSTFQWDLFICTALETAMRRGELLNLCWSEIDFDEEAIDITGKANTEHTWEWLIKDADERTVPLSQLTTKLLIELQAKRPVGYPYVFIPPQRYDAIQRRRAKGDWTYSDSRHETFNNFYHHFGKIQTAANIKKHGTFHDLRRTALSNWLAQGVSEYELMTLAGHSSFQTTHEFYLSVKKDHLDKARRASNKGFARVLVEPVESGTIAEDDCSDE